MTEDAPPPLTTNQLDWIVAASLKHFAEQVERVEVSILRNERFADEALATDMPDDTRAEEIARARRYLGEYRVIVRHLHQLKAKLSRRAAGESAMAIEAFLREGRDRRRGR